VVRPPALRIGDACRLARVKPNGLLPALDGWLDELGEDDGLGLVRVRPADHQGVGIAPVAVCGSVIVEACIPNARRRRDVGGGVVKGEGRGVDQGGRVAEVPVTGVSGRQGLLAAVAGLRRVIIRAGNAGVAGQTLVEEEALAECGLGLVDLKGG